MSAAGVELDRAMVAALLKLGPAEHRRACRECRTPVPQSKLTDGLCGACIDQPELFDPGPRTDPTGGGGLR